MKQCKLEIATGMFMLVNFDRNEDDMPEVYEAFIIDAEDNSIPYKLPQEAYDNVVDLINDELIELSTLVTTVVDI